MATAGSVRRNEFVRDTISDVVMPTVELNI